MTWPTFSERVAAGSPLLLPLGALEQHGPHLPLATDSVIVERLAARVGADVDGIVLPTVAYGAPSRPRSGGGDLFPAPALPLQLLFDVVEALARSTHELGARIFVVLSWHWENASVLWDALQGVFGRPGPKALIFDSPADTLSSDLLAELFPEGFPGWAIEHAGRLETALMSYVAGNLVGTPPRVQYRARSYDVLPTPKDAVPANGVFYDPRGASAELGRRCFEEMARSITDAIRNESSSDSGHEDPPTANKGGP